MDEDIETRGPQTRSSRWSAKAATVCAGIGLALSVGGIGLAVWSLMWATRTVPQRNWDDTLPGRTAGWLMVVGLVVSIVVLRALRRGTWATAMFVSIGATVLLIGSALLPGGLASNYSRIMAGYTPSQEVPAAFASWILVTAGVVAVVFGAMVLIGAPQVGRVGLASGVVVGVVAAVVVASVVMQDADPNRRFDSSTAAEIPMPSIPVALGAESFTVHLDSRRFIDFGTIRAAGPGFVARTERGVRAFDSAGKERWHYQSLAETRWPLTDFRVFDGGRTVVLTFSSGARVTGEVVGLDATTGRLLWRSTDPRIVKQFNAFATLADRGKRDPLYLTVRNGSDLSRIDTRTGRRLWSARVPDSVVPMDTEAGVGYFAGTMTDGRVEIRYVSLDPQTGAVRIDVAASSFSARDLDEFDATQVSEPVHAGRNGVVFRAGGRTHYLNGGTGAVSPFDGSVLFGNVTADAFVASVYERDADTTTEALRDGSDGRIRCALPADSVVVPTAWLADEMLSIGGSKDVTVYRQSDCTAVPRRGPGAPQGTVIVVPGAVLVVSADSTVITGYT